MTATAFSSVLGEETTRRRQSTRLLLVDSDHEIRALMGRFFEMRGFECQGAADAESAERLFQQKPFDLVIAAAALPVTSGFELLARLRSRHRLLPLVLLRGFDGVDAQQNRTEAARLGAHFLAKPIRLSSLLDTAHEALEEARQSVLAARAAAMEASAFVPAATPSVGMASAAAAPA
jgi:DNA-binding response OmpR family regulator